MAIWQDLVADSGFRGSYQAVKRFVRKLRGNQPTHARAVIITAPEEEVQVDYGSKGPMVRDAQTGKYRRTRLFVMTLGYSRKAVRLLTFRSSARGQNGLGVVYSIAKGVDRNLRRAAEWFRKAAE